MLTVGLSLITRNKIPQSHQAHHKHTVAYLCSLVTQQREMCQEEIQSVRHGWVSVSALH